VDHLPVGLPAPAAALPHFLHLDGEIVEQLGRGVPVEVLGEVVEEQPVGEEAVLHDGAEAVLVDVAEAGPAEHPLAEHDAPVVQDHGEDAPHEAQRRHHGQEDEPVPQEQVDLLVDDIEGHDAECVVLLDGSGRTELLESAFRHLQPTTDNTS